MIFVSTFEPDYKNVELLVLLITVTKKSKKSFKPCITVEKHYMHKAKNSLATIVSNSIKKSSQHRNFCIHGGRIKTINKMPKLKDADDSNAHILVFNTKCNLLSCEKINCADITNPKAPLCPGRTPTLNEQTIPPTSNGFKTVIGGNLTSKIPKLKKGFFFKHNRNYKGQIKQQAIVVEKPNSTPVNSHDIKLNLQASKFLQNQQNHDDIQNNT
jgi:hypothetical protein